MLQNHNKILAKKKGIYRRIILFLLNFKASEYEYVSFLPINKPLMKNKIESAIVVITDPNFMLMKGTRSNH